MDKKEFELEKELIELRHKYKMEEFAEERRNVLYSHEKELEKIRIKSAEIKRGLEMKRRNYQ
jgi:hypothetical protein